MNFNQLRAFYMVAKAGSFSRGARQLFVTEPAVFVQVRSLERYLGAALFDRYDKGLETTEVGRMLFEYANKIFGLERDADMAVHQLQNFKRGELQIGSAKGLAHLIPFVVTSFNDSYPAIKILVCEDSSDKLVKGVINHELEFALVARISYPDEIVSIPFSKDKVLLVVSPENAILRKEEVHFDELNDQQVIWRDVESAMRFTMGAEFEKRGLKPYSHIESNSIEFIKAMVKKGKGCAFLGANCIRNEIDRGELAAVRIQGGKFELDIEIVHLKGKTLSPAAGHFLDFIQKSTDYKNLSRVAASSLCS